MNLKKITVFNYFFILCTISPLTGDGVWVNYGWELFDHVTNARIAALGNATTAYAMPTAAAAVVNPFFVFESQNKVELTHQSRFAGLINSDILSGQVMIQKKTRMGFNVLYEGIGSIPDTRETLLDWGLDGVFGTQDAGEGNGILDEGERLDGDQVRYFSQQQVGIHGAFLRKIRGRALGLGVKVLSYSLDTHYALGLGMDLGMIKKINNIDFGFVMRNIPSSGLIWDHGMIEATTPSMAFGLHVPYSSETLPLEMHTLMNVNFSGNTRHLGSQIRAGTISLDSSFGVEAIVRKRLSFRFGKNQLGNMTGGLGVLWTGFGVDYAFLASDLNSGLGNHHLLTLRISPDWIRAFILVDQEL